MPIPLHPASTDTWEPTAPAAATSTLPAVVGGKTKIFVTYVNFRGKNRTLKQQVEACISKVNSTIDDDYKIVIPIEEESLNTIIVRNEDVNLVKDCIEMLVPKSGRSKPKIIATPDLRQRRKRKRTKSRRKKYTRRGTRTRNL
tara:strand:- start:177 stop:605 length:429 start_codon:yes stop_codon:yes gene_type:complete